MVATGHSPLLWSVSPSKPRACADPERPWTVATVPPQFPPPRRRTSPAAGPAAEPTTHAGSGGDGLRRPGRRGDPPLPDSNRPGELPPPESDHAATVRTTLPRV